MYQEAKLEPRVGPSAARSGRGGLNDALDPLTHAVPAYAAAFVRAHGPAFMQEWGTLLTSGKAQQDGYLRGCGLHVCRLVLRMSI